MGINKHLNTLLIARTEATQTLLANTLASIDDWTWQLDYTPYNQAAMLALSNNQYTLCFIHLTAQDEPSIIETLMQQTPIIALLDTDHPKTSIAVFEAGAAESIVMTQLTTNRVIQAIAQALRYAQLTRERGRYRHLMRQHHDSASSVQHSRTQRRLTQALHDITVALNSTLHFNELLEVILTTVGRVIPHDRVEIAICEDDTAKIIGYKDHNGHRIVDPVMHLPVSEMATFRYMMETGQPILVSDTRHFAEWHTIPTTDWIRSYLGAPILLQGEVIGFINLTSGTPGFFSITHKQRVEPLAAQIGVAIGNTRLFEQVQNYAAQLEARIAERTFKLQMLYELAQSLGHATGLSDIVRLILVHLYRLVNCDVTAILLVTPNLKRFVIQSQRPLTDSLERTIEAQACYHLGKLQQRSIGRIGLQVQRLHSTADDQPVEPLSQLAKMVHAPIQVNDQLVGILLVGDEIANADTDYKRYTQITADQAGEAIGRLQALTEARYQHLESLITHLPNGVILLDANRRIVLANPRAYHYLELLGTANAGDTLVRLGAYYLADMLHWPAARYPLEVEVSPADTHIFEITMQPVHNGEAPENRIILIRDVTEERTAQRRIRQQERMAVVGQLAAGIAHDFNNILTSIIGYAELLDITPGISAEAKSDLGRIIKQGRRAADLVHQILDFSRDVPLKKRTVDLLPYLKETIKLLERTLPETIQLFLAIRPGVQSCIIEADLAQIQQAITNLALNARDAMVNGGELHIQVDQIVFSAGQRLPCPDMSSGSWIHVTVIDTGDGIEAKHLPHIFEPFFTTKPVGKGTGLGLAQVYGIIVNQHGGCITVESDVGQGTSFHLYLPALPTPVVKPKKTGQTNPLPGHGEMILVVEDDPAVLTISQNMLEHLGYQVVTALNGPLALQAFAQYAQQIQLVITDLTMPHMSGATLARQLRERKPALKIIGLTGYPITSPEKMAKLLGNDISDWLEKPLTIDTLSDRVRRALAAASPD